MQQKKKNRIIVLILASLVCQIGVAQNVRLGLLPGQTQGAFSTKVESASCVAFSPDGKLLASGTASTVKLWDVATGGVLKRLSGHSSTVKSVSFSPDGKTLFSQSLDEVKLWDVATGQEIRTFSGHLDQITTMSLSMNGSILATGEDYKTVRLWDVASGKALKEFSSPVQLVRFSPDGKILAIQGIDGALVSSTKLLDVATGKQLGVIPTLRGVLSILFSPDGKSLLVGDVIQLKVWDVATCQVREIVNDGGYSSIAFTPDGKSMVGADAENSIKLWDANSGEVARTFRGVDSRVKSLSVSPDGKTLASANIDGVTLWDLTPTKLLSTLAGPDSRVMCISLSADGKT